MYYVLCYIYYLLYILFMYYVIYIMYYIYYLCIILCVIPVNTCVVRYQIFHIYIDTGTFGVRGGSLSHGVRTVCMHTGVCVCVFCLFVCGYVGVWVCGYVVM
jgi:hypothetical protein